MTQPQAPLTYRDAGVDIDAGDALVDRIKPMAARTMREGVLAGIGGFGALFEVPKRYKEPVLVSGTDGVGTKLKLAFDWQRHDTVGIDLVAMSVNDILVQGAEPLFFLDYFACGKLSVDVAAQVVGGIARGCELSGCALIGGETAEMPGMYPDGEYDLAGFAVGAAEKSALIDGKSIQPGDVVLGGGLLDNVPRILQPGLQASLRRDAWQMPQLFTWLQQKGGVADTEMYRVFNCGVGMVVVVSADDATAISQALVAQGETVYALGVIQGCQATDAQTIVV